MLILSVIFVIHQIIKLESCLKKGTTGLFELGEHDFKAFQINQTLYLDIQPSNIQKPKKRGRPRKNLEQNMVTARKGRHRKLAML